MQLIQKIGIGFITRLRGLFIPSNWINFIKNIGRAFVSLVRWIAHFTLFFIVFGNFFVIELLSFTKKIPFIKKLGDKLLPLWLQTVNTGINTLLRKVENNNQQEVDRSYLIFLAIQNLKNKAGRSLITILGMSIGVGIIVYLLSLGYGIERLVIGQVATLDELKIVDVSASQNTALQLNNMALKKIEKIKNVKDAIPLISLVGRIDYQKAKTDILVYAATKKYLETARIQTIRGKIFSSESGKEEALDAPSVAGVKSSIQQAHFKSSLYPRPINFNLLPQEDIAVRDDCTIESQVVGYTTYIEGGFIGEAMWGGMYSPYDPYGRVGYDAIQKRYVGKWMSAKYPMYDKTPEGLRPQLDDNGHLLWEHGCVQMKYARPIDAPSFSGDVLGVASSSATTTSSATSSASAQLDTSSVEATSSALSLYDVELISSDSSGIELVQLKASDSASVVKKNPELPFLTKPSAQAIISTGLMKLLGLNINRALGTKFDVSFIVVKSLLPTVKGRAFSKQVRYNVIGVVEDDENQYFYIPFSDMKALGIANVSQLKVVVDDKTDLSSVRNNIETIGYSTSSVVDTVSQIEQLFASVRMVLALIGLIALGVASLGMFNTLTVSLLERTREIGGMKTIGMISTEILDLFLAEAMIMGFSGGMGGLFMGWAAGQVTSFLISLVAISQGAGYMHLTYIPTTFVIFIVSLSFIVGVVTGLYPARRARKISALDALRYE